jgi:hypothetical protein
VEDPVAPVELEGEVVGHGQRGAARDQQLGLGVAVLAPSSTRRSPSRPARTLYQLSEVDIQAAHQAVGQIG